MLCSVVIPLYNKASFIVTAIESVLSQSHQSFQILVIDDGSTDNSALLVNSLSDSRIKLIQQSNAGVSSARNKGIALAEGELICFLDADDWYHPDYLKTIVGLASKHPDLSMFATAYKRVPLKANTPPPPPEICDDRPIEIISNIYEKWRKRGAFFCTNSVSIRAQLLKSLQPCFPLGESLGEDQDLWFRLGEISPLAYCSSAHVGYRVDVADSLCASKQLTELPPVYIRLEERAIKNRLPKHLRNSALKLVAESRITIARATILQGQRIKALKQLLTAWKGIPSRRWWVSVAMCLLSTSAIRNWEQWRINVGK